MTTLNKLKYALDSAIYAMKHMDSHPISSSAISDYREASARLVREHETITNLLRVIELAEDALDYALSQMQPFCSDEKVKQALSEIRKLKGK